VAELAVTGVDACARGWVAVTLGPGAVVRVTVAATLDALPLAGLPPAGVTGIDMPLGLLAAGWRDADLLARRALGRRGVTVFAIPPRPVWECESYAEASRLCRELTGKSFSVQAWGLRRKIFEADAYRRSAVAPVRHAVGPGGACAAPGSDGGHLYEVHPELAFAALAGAPLADSKHTKAGLAARRGLLALAGIDVPRRVPGAAENDLLDAAAVAWSARRIAVGQAVVLASPSQRADDGTEIAIRY
jgi:predicted RNase H-like nuclease